jgi:hypothetical protein
MNQVADAETPGSVWKNLKSWRNGSAQAQKNIYNIFGKCL